MKKDRSWLWSKSHKTRCQVPIEDRHPLPIAPTLSSPPASDTRENRIIIANSKDILLTPAVIRALPPESPVSSIEWMPLGNGPTQADESNWQGWLHAWAAKQLGRPLSDIVMRDILPNDVGLTSWRMDVQTHSWVSECACLLVTAIGVDPKDAGAVDTVSFIAGNTRRLAMSIAPLFLPTGKTGDDVWTYSPMGWLRMPIVWSRFYRARIELGKGDIYSRPDLPVTIILRGYIAEIDGDKICM